MSAPTFSHKADGKTKSSGSSASLFQYLGGSGGVGFGHMAAKSNNPKTLNNGLGFKLASENAFNAPNKRKSLI